MRAAPKVDEVASTIRSTPGRTPRGPGWRALLTLALSVLPCAVAHADPPPAAAPKPLDVAAPPFGDGDYSWMNGSNRQPASLLVSGPLTWSLYVDTYFAFAASQPVDHTIFPSSVAARHDELSLNLAAIGVEVAAPDTAWGSPIGRLYFQYGSNVATIAGQDPTTRRGFYLDASAVQYVQQGAVGWHFHSMHGVNVELGIFPSYIGLESYLPQENWSYTHSWISDSTPYYFWGLRVQLFPTERFKLELWLVNGWQTYSQWHEARAGGYLWNWRPREWISLVNSGYVGQEAQGDPDSLRIYTDNNLQVRYYRRRTPGFLRSAALSLVGDVGWEHRGNDSSGVMGGAILSHRLEWTDIWATTVRGDVVFDETHAILPALPLGAPAHALRRGMFVAGGLTVTIDCSPSPWVIFRLEYAHRETSQPYLSGPGGITGPGGTAPPAGVPFAPDLRTSDDRFILDATLRL